LIVYKVKRERFVVQLGFRLESAAVLELKLKAVAEKAESRS
jgi:hypothetical protein